MMAGLPRMPVTPHEHPFTNTGVDYFGPMLVKRGKYVVKRRGALFTCLNVHIEIADSMDTSSFLNAFRRFIGRRGEPSDIWSDNGRSISTEPELVHKGIRWLFQLPGASHMSGVWERLLRSVKLAFKSRSWMMLRSTFHLSR